MDATNAVGVEFFVTPHAVTQFQLRIATLDDAAARDVILAGIREATNVSVLPDGDTLRVRTKRPFPYEFRAYCVFDERRGHRVVTTITRGDSSVTRKRRRKEREAVARNDD